MRSSLIALPGGSEALLRGQYTDPAGVLQIVRPRDVLDELLDTVVTVEGYVVAALAVVGVAALATAALVFVLSLRLRRREMETMRRIGGASSRIAAVVLLEIAVVLGASVLLAAALTWLTATLGADALAAWLR